MAGHELIISSSVPRGFAEDEDANRTLPVGRWVNSHELRVGDVVIGLSGEQLRINSIAQRWEESFPVSNLEIGEFHNYAVGLDGVLVHNHTICERGEALLKQGFDSGEYTVADLRKMVEGFENGDEVLKRIAPSEADNTKPAWLQRLDEGNAFNKSQSLNYDYNEVYIDKPGVDTIA